jgi:hypothetical protein
MSRRTELWLSALIVLFAVPVHLMGLLVPSLYRDPAILLPQNSGTDLVTLCVGVPVLALATVAMRGGSVRARLLWLGALGYLVYAYGMYALAVRWNPLFLAYVALFGLSFFALAIGLMETDASRIRAGLVGRAPVRLVAAYLTLIAVLVGAMWLAEEVAALLGGTVPPSVVQFATPTNIVHVFDLGLVLPAMVLAAVLLLRDRPWGYVLAGMLLVKATTIGLWVVVMIWFSAHQGFGAPPAYAAFFVSLTAVGGVLTWRFTRSRSADACGLDGRRAAVSCGSRGAPGLPAAMWADRSTTTPSYCRSANGPGPLSRANPRPPHPPSIA